MFDTSGLQRARYEAKVREVAAREAGKAERGRRKACHGNWHPCGPEESCGR